MLRFVLDCLKHRDVEITIAYYEPYSLSPELSVPLFKLPLLKKPSTNQAQFENHSCVGIGCWLPELEFTNYWASKSWLKLIKEHDVYLSVSGNVLAALPFVQMRLPFLSWTATDWHGDRTQRVSEFNLFRLLLDKIVVRPMMSYLERKIVNTNNVVALSEYSQRQLNKVSKSNAVDRVMTMPIEIDHFKPTDSNKQPQHQAIKLGFVGRFEDPRKHLSLLFETVKQIINKGQEVHLTIVGDKLSEKNKKLVSQLGITNFVTDIAYVEREKLPTIIGQWDIFVLPSYQEGLCIAALEAMSCGLPIVSTRCGGPEDYIIDGSNGILCEHNAEQLSDAILQLSSDPEKLKRYGASARQMVVNQFSVTAKQEQYLRMFDQLALT